MSCVNLSWFASASENLYSPSKHDRQQTIIYKQYKGNQTIIAQKKDTQSSLQTYSYTLGP